jgi:DHA2 family multidrug resistance protein
MIFPGDTLAIIEDAEFRFRLAQSEAAYQNALAGKQVASSSVNTAQSNISVSEAGIAEAEALLANAQKEYTRYKNLLAQESVTQQEFDAVNSKYLALKAKHAAIKGQKQSTVLVRQEQNVRLSQNEAGIRLAKAALNLAAANEMVGASALLREDILMAGYASLAGMALTIVIMLRLKMRFTSKFTFLVCCLVLVICNLISLHADNLLLLVATCFVAGIFKMWATFACNSSIQLWLTPKRDLSIFFCFIYLLVHGSILLSGITNLYVALFSNWEYMHWFIIGALLVLVLAVLLLFNNKRMMPPFPLFGIDWMGGFMWGLILLCVNFISIYGDHYDWWYSGEIQLATVFLVVLLALNIYRASFIRHPFISLQTFRYKAVYLTIFLYLLIDIFLAPAHLIEHIYFEKILHYDATHLSYVNWMGYTGVLFGAGFTYYYFALKKNSYKSTFLVGFTAILGYLGMMYFLIGYQTTKAMLFAPIFFRNFGYVVVAIVLLTNLVKVPFHHFFQAVSIQAFVSAACGSALGAAVLHHLFAGITTKNFQLLSAQLDGVNYKLASLAPQQLSNLLQNQVLMTSFKEVYGLLLLWGMACLAVFLFYKYPYLPVKALYPKMRTIKKLLRREMASRLRLAGSRLYKIKTI